MWVLTFFKSVIQFSLFSARALRFLSPLIPIFFLTCHTEWVPWSSFKFFSSLLFHLKWAILMLTFSYLVKNYFFTGWGRLSYYQATTWNTRPPNL
jgi:hypothetical protein